MFKEVSSMLTNKPQPEQRAQEPNPESERDSEIGKLLKKSRSTGPVAVPGIPLAATFSPSNEASKISDLKNAAGNLGNYLDQRLSAHLEATRTQTRIDEYEQLSRLGPELKSQTHSLRANTAELAGLKFPKLDRAKFSQPSQDSSQETELELAEEMIAVTGRALGEVSSFIERLSGNGANQSLASQLRTESRNLGALAEGPKVALNTSAKGSIASLSAGLKQV